MADALSSCNPTSLEKFLDRVFPKFAQVLEANSKSSAFDSYQAMWSEEREDIIEAYCLKTDFDFKEANRAV
jgi:hypothetical protein